MVACQNADGSHLEISAGALEKPIWRCGKCSSFKGSSLLFIKAVKQAWHQDKEELTFLGY